MNDKMEKRKFQRLDYPLKGTIKIVPSKENPTAQPSLDIKSRNISKEGICLEIKATDIKGINLLSGSPYAREHRIYIQMELNPNEQLFEASGEVSWYDISLDTIDHIYQVGVEFIEVKSHDKAQLLRFLNNNKIDDSFLKKLFK